MTEIPFVWLSLSFMTGILLQPFYDPRVVWPLLLMHMLVLFLTRGKKTFWFFLLSGVLLLGMIFGNLDRNPVKSGLQREMEKRELPALFPIYGKVLTEPELKISGRKQTASFVLESSGFLVPEKESHPRFRNAKGKVQVFLNQPQQIPEVGEQIRLWGKLEPLPPVRNPGEFDYRRYLENRDIHFILNAYGGKSYQTRQASGRWNAARLLSKVRQKIRTASDYLFRREESLLVRALILGDRKNLRGKLLDDFLKTGTSHLLAISGLNISLVAGSIYLILIVLRIPQKKAAWTALLLAMFQVAIAGFGIPVQRAGIMACFGFLALILERERSGLNLFSLAMGVLLLCDTRNLESISFQLSFLSLFSLIVFSHFWRHQGSWKEAWVSSLAVLMGTFPVVIYHFSTFSPVGILANILGIPLFHFVLLTSFLALIFGFIPAIGTVPVLLCRFFIKTGLGWIHFCGLMDWGYFFLPRPSWALMITYYVFLTGFLLLLNYKPIRFRHLWAVPLLGWCAAAAVFFIPPKQDTFLATVFSAGSNEITHLQFGRENHWLVNAGRTFPGDQAQWILAPYLKSHGIKKIKGVLFSDARKRHTSGYETLSRNFQIQYKAAPKPDKSRILFPPDYVLLDSQDRILMPEGAAIEILGNFRGSLTFRVLISGQSCLFLPEVSYPVFKQLAQIKNRHADLLILPAERYSDSPLLKAILTLIQPKAVIGAKFKEESREVFKSRGVKFYETFAEGAVQIRLKELETAAEFEILPFRTGAESGGLNLGRGNA